MKKKYGPLPLWAWVVVIGGTIGVYLLYKNGSSSSTASSTAATDAQLAAEQAAMEQAVGNTGTGGASGSGDTGTTPFDPNSLGPIIAAAIQASGIQGAPGIDGVNGVDGVDATASTPSPGDTTAGATTAPVAGTATPPTVVARSGLPDLKGNGAVRAPSGHFRPNAPAGYTALGLGNGNWEFVPAISLTTTHTAAGNQPYTPATFDKARAAAGQPSHAPEKGRVVSGKKKRK